MQTIDVTPKWEAMMRVMLAVLENPKASAESKQSMREELISLGRWVDQVNEERKQGIYEREQGS
jgi:hypothetical protein